MCPGKWSVWSEVCQSAWGEDRDSCWLTGWTSVWCIPWPCFTRLLAEFISLPKWNFFVKTSRKMSVAFIVHMIASFCQCNLQYTSVYVAPHFGGQQQSSVWIKEWILQPELDLGCWKCVCVMWDWSCLSWATFQDQRCLSLSAKYDKSYTSHDWKKC